MPAFPESGLRVLNEPELLWDSLGFNPRKGLDDVPARIGEPREVTVVQQRHGVASDKQQRAFLVQHFSAAVELPTALIDESSAAGAYNERRVCEPDEHALWSILEEPPAAGVVRVVAGDEVAQRGVADRLVAP